MITRRRRRRSRTPASAGSPGCSGSRATSGCATPIRSASGPVSPSCRCCASVWSREWIGWWCLVPVALSLIFMVVNPLLFATPRSTRNWASKGVFGERIWADRNQYDARPVRRVPGTRVAPACQFVGLAVLAWGLVELDLLATVAGMVLVQGAKAWYIDRMVLLFEDMKTRRSEYAAWEY